ncbi:MAG: membrane-bound lytic murein transglycosylase B [bacterium]|jgi:membrane-bound lytic murein transglycosylase B
MLHKNCLRFYQIILLSLFCFSSFILYAKPKPVIQENLISKSERIYLVQVFSKQGFQKKWLKKIFFDSRLLRIPKLVTKNVINKEPTRGYRRFYNRYSIYRAKNFRKRWRTRLRRAQKKYGVDPNVVSAILLIESSYGRFTGGHRVINVFSTLYLENRPDRLKKVKERIKDPKLQKYYLKRIKRKAKWAFSEMKSVLKIAQKRWVKSIYQLEGSYAGAFGIPQFLPSSYMKWAVDGDRSGRKDLFTIPDAIASTANFLKVHGWKPSLNYRQKSKVIWQYNNSTIYARTVLGVAWRIHKQRKRRKKI